MEKFLENAFPYAEENIKFFMELLKMIPDYSKVFEMQLEKNHLWQEVVEKTKDENGCYHVAYLVNVQESKMIDSLLFIVLRLLKKEDKVIPVIEIRNEEFDIEDFLKDAKPMYADAENRKFRKHLSEIENYREIFANLVRTMPEWITVSDMYPVETFYDAEGSKTRYFSSECKKELSLRIFNGGVCPVVKIYKYHVR